MKHLSNTNSQQEFSFIDSHCHLDMEAYKDDLNEVIQRSLSANVKTIITIGVDEKSSFKAVSLAKTHSCVKASIGVHPHDVANINSKTYKNLTNLAVTNSHEVIAYGEIGLDYAKNYSPKDIQIKEFNNQLSIANELKLPIIIHDRESHDDMYKILKKQAPFETGGVMHCFSGNIEFAKKIIDIGLHISIPGIVTFKNATALQEVAKKIPLSSLIIETDGPFLAPTPWRGKRNEPSYILQTAHKVAELRGISIDELAEATFNNTTKLFNLE